MIGRRGGRRCCAGLQSKRILLPLACDCGDSCGGDGLAAVITHEVYCDGANVARTFGIERAFVFGVGLDGHAPVTDVQHPCLILVVGFVHIEAQAGFQCFTGAGGFIGFDFRRGIATLDEVPVIDAAPITAKGAIAYHFGVEPAIVGVVDLFGHQAVESLADRRDLLVGVNGEFDRRSLCGGDDGCEGKKSGGKASKRFLQHAQKYLSGERVSISQ